MANVSLWKWLPPKYVFGYWDDQCFHGLLHVCYLIAQEITSCWAQVELVFNLYLLIVSYKG